MELRAIKVPTKDRERVEVAKIGDSRLSRHRVRQDVSPDLVIVSKPHADLDHLFKNERATRIVRKEYANLVKAHGALAASSCSPAGSEPPTKRLKPPRDVYGDVSIVRKDCLLGILTDVPAWLKTSDIEPLRLPTEASSPPV